MRREVIALGLPLRSVEVELGPSQCEFTFQPQVGPRAGRHHDAVPQRREADLPPARLSRDLHVPAEGGERDVQRLAPAPIAARPRHQRQRLHVRATRSCCRRIGRHFLAGLLAHARAAAAFTTPTINGYKRYRRYSLAPDRAIWARDNRGVMIRVLGGPGDPATRLENRIGEPAANPYLYMASQIFTGLDGMERMLDPGPSADTPYEAQGTASAEEPRGGARRVAQRCLPDRRLRPQLRRLFHLRIKEAEIARYQSEVTEWEQREYFELF